MPLPLAAIIAGGSTLLGSAISSFTGRSAQNQANQQNLQIARENNAFAKSESELAFQRQQQMTREQNAYNSPEAQMQRYEQAGLNKNLIYGQGTPGNQSGTPTYIPASRTTPTMQSKGSVNLGLDNAVQGAINYRMADLDIEARKQQNRILQTQADAAQADYLLNYGYGYGTPNPSNPNIDSWRGMQLLGKSNSAYYKSQSDMYNMDAANKRRHILSEQLLKAQMDNAVQKASMGSLSKMAAADRKSVV